MINRRKAMIRLSQGSLGSYGLLAGLSSGCTSKRKKAQQKAQKKLSLSSSASTSSSLPKNIITITCSGGGEILDSFMALSRNEVEQAGGDPRFLNCFVRDQEVKSIANTPFKAVDLTKEIPNLGNFQVNSNQSAFVQKHSQDLMVATTYLSSVNHAVAQERSLNGNEAWSGRTIQECVAAEYGKDLALANLNMASGGYGIPGKDDSLPDYAQQTRVTNPIFFALSLHSTIGLPNVPKKEVLDIARDLRKAELELNSNFYQTFANSSELKKYHDYRLNKRKLYEDMELINRLFFLESTQGDLRGSEEAEMLRATFPNYLSDPFETQAILAYLSISQGLSCAVSIGPSFSAAFGSAGVEELINPPIAFDFSHQDHRGIQAFMWQRVLNVADKLSDLFKSKSEGESTLWDRSAIYFASDFGRDKIRPEDADTFSSGHHLHNAAVILSPLANGNKVLGGVDPQTGLTYGFDVETGASQPGSLPTSEKKFFSGLVGMMGIDKSKSPGLPDVRSMRKQA